MPEFIITVYRLINEFDRKVSQFLAMKGSVLEKE